MNDLNHTNTATLISIRNRAKARLDEILGRDVYLQMVCSNTPTHRINPRTYAFEPDPFAARGLHIDIVAIGLPVPPHVTHCELTLYEEVDADEVVERIVSLVMQGFKPRE